MSEQPEGPTEPEPTVVVAAMRRPSFSPDMFVDLVRDDVQIIARDTGKPRWTLTFLGTEPGPALDEATVAAVKARMESTDDDDQAARAGMLTLRDELLALGAPETFEQLVAAIPVLVDAAVAGLNYQLGETT